MVKRIVFLLLLVSLGCSEAGYTQLKPNTFHLDGHLLKYNKLRLKAKSDQHQEALQKLVYRANKILSKKSYTIVTKQATPPSGDKHDYLSLAPYWWPNPNRPNGLPYINKDGKANPEANKTKDKNQIIYLSKDVNLLGLAYYFTGEEKYAKKATELIQDFFFNSDTKMNPNLNYGQAIRGIVGGRVEGLIEAYYFIYLIDGVQLLAGSTSWTTNDDKALKKWFDQFLDWMLTSPTGKEGVNASNNIGTYYDLQIVTYSLFIGNCSLAKSYLENKTLKRIARQFGPDGSQPLELKRTKAWTYCIKNLNGWFSLARLGEKVGVDIWNYYTSDGKSLRKATLWMLPYAAGQKEWPYKDIAGIKFEWFIPIAKVASIKYMDDSFQVYLAGLPSFPENEELLIH